MNDHIGPLLTRARRLQGKLERLAYGELYMEKNIYEVLRVQFLAGAQSVSGPGSDLEQTAMIRRRLPVLFERYGIRTVLDIPCGDFPG